jgi:hypothetical protein
MNIRDLSKLTGRDTKEEEEHERPEWDWLKK